MKNLLVTAFATALVAGSVQAYTVSFVNVRQADATAVPVVDNSGAAIGQGSGYVAAGFFADPSNITFESLSSFRPFGDGATTSFNGIADGFFDLSREQSLPFGTQGSPVGESLFVVIGNGSDLNSSTEFAVLDAGQVVSTENQAGQGANDIIVTDDFLNVDNLVLGSVATSVDTGVGVVFNEAIQLVPSAPIPEPSTALLGLLGLIAGVSRRRR